VNQDLEPQEVTQRGTAKQRKKIFSELIELHSLHSAAQRTAFRMFPDESISREQFRLEIYDHYYPRILECTLRLASFDKMKQAGGKPIKKHFELAYKILSEHFIETSTILKPKELSRRSLQRLQEKGYVLKSAEDDPVSIRYAREVIFVFKAGLPYETFYKN
jgi:hypothetical protein